MQNLDEVIAAHRAGINYRRGHNWYDAKHQAAVLYPEDRVLDATSNITEREAFLMGYTNGNLWMRALQTTTVSMLDRSYYSYFGPDETICQNDGKPWRT
jgi:hypothetical protein